MRDYSTESAGPHETDARAELLAPGTVIGSRYRIESLLGQGGYAHVYAAFDEQLRSTIALKVLRPDRINDVAIKRFRREVAIARSVQSPRLLRIFDIGQSDGLTFVTMEMARGGTLRERMSAGPIPIGEVITLATEIATALAELHAAGIVHRDVKPSNILLDGSDLRLADFGLALRTDGEDSRYTGTAGLVGTLEYLSPEQALGNPIDARSDLYSLGVVLFEMLTGRLPFVTGSSIEALVAHLQRPAPDARQLRRDTPRWLARLVTMLLEKKPPDRPASPAVVVSALRSRRAPGRALRKTIWPTAIAIAILAAIALGGWLWHRDHQFASIASDGKGGMRALDRGGRTMWQRPGIDPQFDAVIMHRADGDHWIAVVPHRLGETDYEKTHHLQVFRAHTGSLVQTVVLPDAGSTFSSYSNRFSIVSLATADLDASGNDVLIMSYIHENSWPSYTVAWDPREGNVRTVFIGSGHHRYAFSADVNGDGRKDLILVGVNNRMGWYSVATAVDFPPLTRTPTGDVYPIGSSPDGYYTISTRAVLWYKLLPRGHIVAPFLHADGLPQPWIDIQYLDGRHERIGLDGFDPGSLARNSATRERARHAVYDLLRESQRLSTAGFHTEALNTLIRAATDADTAADAELSEWVSRVKALCLVQSGRFDDAQAEATRISQNSEAASEIAFELARALHKQGQLSAATRWYARGLGISGDQTGGRGRYEFIEGAVLALGELGRWPDALEQVARFERSYPDQAHFVRAYRAWVDWRTSGSANPDASDLQAFQPDILKYWALEEMMARGDSPPAILRLVDVAEAHWSGSKSHLLSLRSELQLRLGNRTAALELARKAFETAVADRSTDTAVHAHFDLYAKRYARIARMLGHDDEARAADVALQKQIAQNR